MRFTVRTKSGGAFDVELTDGVKFGLSGYESGSAHTVGDLVSIGASEGGPVYVSKDEIIAITPAEGVGPPA